MRKLTLLSIVLGSVGALSFGALSSRARLEAENSGVSYYEHYSSANLEFQKNLQRQARFYDAGALASIAVALVGYSYRRIVLRT